MSKKSHINAAENMLALLIKSQPDLLHYEKGNELNGKNAAQFCTGFIETYAAWLEKQEKSND